MANILLARDIEKAYTDKINEYIARGMWVNVNTMSGTQGETAKIDVTDGESIYRIRLNRDYFNSRDGEEFTSRTEAIVLTVEKFKNEGRGLCDGFAILWAGKGEIVEEKTWYVISDRRMTAFVESIEDLKEITKIKDDRFEFTCGRTVAVTDPVRLALIYKLVKKQKGYSSVTKKSIQKVVKYRNGNRYTVFFTPDSRKMSLLIRN